MILENEQFPLSMFQSKRQAIPPAKVHLGEAKASVKPVP
jgi:hypothetical protein